MRRPRPQPQPLLTLEARIEALDWTRMRADLEASGCARTGPLLSAAECTAMRERFEAEDGFRSRVDMARHGYGQGVYKYFDHPLPPVVETLRRRLYPELVPLANAWAVRLRQPGFPPSHTALLRACREAGQHRPTPLLLTYQAGDFNRLHQDLYGPLVFPFQATFLLSVPGQDFEGGEFVLVEQKPRSQSRAEVVPLAHGEGVVFAVHHRPGRGPRGDHRLTMRHGVSRVRAGHRQTLGIIFHDAP